MRTLVLNSGFEPVKVVDWKRAIVMLLTEKAELIAAYQQRIRSVSNSFARPKVIRLKRYINTVKGLARQVPYSRVNVFKRDNYTCQYCSVDLTTRTATLDHIIPQSKGGKDSWENTVACCETCNRKKGNRTPEQAGMKLQKVPRKPNALMYIVSQFGEINWDEIWQAPTEELIL